MRVVRDTLNRLPRLKKGIEVVLLLLHGTPQVSYSEISADLLLQSAGRPDPLILEIGANDGGHTRWFLDVFENSTIYCFEPDPRAAARFRKNVGTHPNVTLLELAMSDRDGEIGFYQSAGTRDGEHVDISTAAGIEPDCAYAARPWPSQKKYHFQQTYHFPKQLSLR
jgi:hypothetical protein